MVRLVYSIIIAICIPFVLLHLLLRGIRSPEYRSRRLERLGFFKAPEQAQDFWIHAVSVGELLAAEPIIRELQTRYPAKRITVTTMTPTSSALVSKLFGDSVYHVYAPYDFPLFVGAFLKRIRPKFVIIMETELWPNMLHGAQKAGCSVVLANARLSERSARGYQRFLLLLSWLFDSLQLVLCQFKPDAERFERLGISPDRIRVTGSLKFDMQFDAELAEKGLILREGLDSEQMIWIAASTHEGEDAKVLAVHQELKQRYPDLLLILVPRHPVRFDSAYRLAHEMGFRVGRYSERESLLPDEDVYVLDVMGQLMRFYAASDIVFIGGSLTEVGGHNPIEPGALGKPMLIGPHYFNFKMICRECMASSSLSVVQDDADLKVQLSRLLQDPKMAAELGNAAFDVVEKGKGAIARVVDAIAPELD